VLQQTVKPAAGSLPAGLLYLRRLAEQLTITGPGPGRNLRVVVTVPTLRLKPSHMAIRYRGPAGTRPLA